MKINSRSRKETEEMRTNSSTFKPNSLIVTESTMFYIKHTYTVMREAGIGSNSARRHIWTLLFNNQNQFVAGQA